MCRKAEKSGELRRAAAACLARAVCSAPVGSSPQRGLGREPRATYMERRGEEAAPAQDSIARGADSLELAGLMHAMQLHRVIQAHHR